MSLQPLKITAIAKTDSGGSNVIPNAAVSIVDAAGGYPQLWLDQSGTTPESNPFTCDSNGEALVYIEGGYYSVAVGGGQSWDVDLSSAVEEKDNYAAVRALSGYVAFSQVSVAGHTARGDGGGGTFLYDSGDVSSADNGVTILVDASGRRWKRIYSVGVVSFSETDGNAAAEAFFADNKPMLVEDGEAAKKTYNSATDDFQAVCNWMTSCTVKGTGSLYIEIANGVHTVSTYVDVDGPGRLLDIRASASPDLIQITGISYASVSGLVYSATVTVASALPAGAVVGGPIGIQNAQGTLDCASINGAQIIQSIAGDRLSFVVHIYSPAGAPSNGVLDNTLTNGLTANQAVIFKGSIIAQSTGWDGTSREGFINALNGGVLSMRFVGISYSGLGGVNGSDEHDILFARGSGSRIHIFDRCGFAGAGDKVLRSYGGAEIYVNRSYIGGAALALELFQGVAGGFNQFIRTSSGGAKTAGYTCGHASFVNFAQAPISTCGIAFRTTTLGSAIACYPAQIHKCSTGILATQGMISGTNATTVKRCTLGVDWAGGGQVVGALIMGTAGDANTSDSSGAANSWYNGGYWLQNTAKTPDFSSAITITAALPKLVMIDGALTAEVSGDSGNVYLNTATASRDVILQAGGVDRFRADMGTTDFHILTNGKGIQVTSPDGLTTRRIGIDNAGAISVTVP